MCRGTPSVGVYHMCEGQRGGQKRASNYLEPELMAARSCLTLVLEPN